MLLESLWNEISGRGLGVYGQNEEKAALYLMIIPKWLGLSRMNPVMKQALQKQWVTVLISPPPRHRGRLLIAATPFGLEEGRAVANHTTECASANHTRGSIAHNHCCTVRWWRWCGKWNRCTECMRGVVAGSKLLLWEQVKKQMLLYEQMLGSTAVCVADVHVSITHW